MLKKQLITATLLLSSCLPWKGQAQEPVYYQSFDKLMPEEITLAEKATSDSPSYFLVNNPTYSEGLKGKALDLTDDVAYRIPLNLPAESNPSYATEASFAIQVWVQTKPNAPQGTPILTNKSADDLKSAGWYIGTHENGAWYLTLSDGENLFTYEPTAQRQAINDGKWHQITLSVDRSKNEVWMYLDGKNVAIYQIDRLKSMDSKLRTVIGGSDDNQDWECRGEWMSFNGKLDEVRIWNRRLTTEEVHRSFTEFFPLSEIYTNQQPERLKVQVWNIWHGGRRFGKQVGVNRVIDVLKQENADVIGLIETYGSGAIIADSLGYYFYLISSNLSILSRYPIEETIQLFRPFNSGGAYIRLSEEQKIAFFDIWLHYLPDISDLHKGKEYVRKFEQDESKSRLAEIRQILKETQKYSEQSSDIPVFVVGDFNTSSNLDWNDKTRPIHEGSMVKLPVCQEMADAGYTDSFRHLYSNVLLNPGATWSPLINTGAEKRSCVPQRIDYIFHKGEKLVPYRSETLVHHPKGWPSDHGSVVSSFYLKE